MKEVVVEQEVKSYFMVISQIRSLYRDANDLLRTVIKRVYEVWDASVAQWRLKKIEFLFPDNDLPFHADRPETVVEHRHGWIVPPEWEFVSEVQEYERKPESEVRYEHKGEVGIMR